MFNKKQKKKGPYYDPVQGKLIVEDNKTPNWLIPLLLPFAVPPWVYGAMFTITFALQALALQDLTLLSKINAGELGPEYLTRLNLHITNYDQLAAWGMGLWVTMIVSAILGVLTWLGRSDSN